MKTHENFDQRPDRGQLAFDGNWEEALSFLPGKFRTEAEVVEYLGKRAEVAFEAFFRDSFFGIRRRGKSEDLVHFVRASAEALHSAKPGEFFQMLSNSLELPLAERFKHAEIGADRAWKSVGPFVIADPKVALESLDSLWTLLLKSPVGRNETRPKAIEFAYDNGDGTTHWFAFSVSENNPPYAISRSKIKNALETYCQIVEGA
jgi:hypothetical protein